MARGAEGGREVPCRETQAGIGRIIMTMIAIRARASRIVGWKRDRSTFIGWAAATDRVHGTRERESRPSILRWVDESGPNGKKGSYSRTNHGRGPATGAGKRSMIRPRSSRASTLSSRSARPPAIVGGPSEGGGASAVGSARQGRFVRIWGAPRSMTIAENPAERRIRGDGKAAPGAGAPGCIRCRHRSCALGKRLSV